jgi:hypothetical protein
MTQQKFIGNLPNQVVVNKHLGSLAFENAETAVIGAVQNQITDTTAIRPSMMIDFANGKNGVSPYLSFTRASTATFMGSNGLIQTAGNNGLRIDHDPATLVCRGALTEPASTNLCSSSTVPSGGYYLTSGTANAGVAPDGTTTATFIKPNSGQQINTASIWYVSSVSNGAKYTLSAFVKPAQFPWQFGLYDNNTGWGVTVIINADGTATGTSAGGSYAQAYPNGWFRIWTTYTTNTTTAYFQIYSSAPVSPDGSTIGYYVWGVQMEQSAFPTSVIPTTSGSATRALETLQLQLSSQPFSSKGDYTWCHNYLCTTALGAASRISSGPDTTFQNIIGVAQSSVDDITQGVGSFFGNGSGVSNVYIRSQVRTAFKSFSNGYQNTMAVNGQLGNESAYANTPYGSYNSQNMAFIYLGYGVASSYNPGPVWHYKIAYYPVAVSNEELVEITK